MTSTLLPRASLPPINLPTLHQLPNGLTILAEQLPVEAVNLSVWIGTGSAAEPDQINGMAHFLEHMVFKGTPRLAAGEFEQRIEEQGAVTNAATSQDYTQYYITTAPQDFAYLAPLQLDVVFNPSIPADAFERERLVVLEEIRRSEDNPGRRSFRQAMETAFESLPYRRPVLGPVSVIEQVTAEQMRAFHGQYYQPQSATVSVVGNLPVEQLIETVANSIEEMQPHCLGPTDLALPISRLLPEPSFTTVVRREIVDESL
ncbi:MAG: insulinase family protein, partial [Oscillatoriales cyanobacterium RM1_1_9]|nr:insulinase family protein [Oscillatoriales cyanobacterium RM1_1_9]